MSTLMSRDRTMTELKYKCEHKSLEINDGANQQQLFPPALPVPVWARFETWLITKRLNNWSDGSWLSI